MQWWKKAIIYTVAILIIYFSGFFTRYGIERKRAMEFSNDGITSIEARNESIGDGITELANSESIIEDGIERSIDIVNDSANSNIRSIDIVESASERIERIEYGLNELYKLQLESEKKE